MISSIADNGCILVHSNMPMFMQIFLYKKKRYMIHVSSILTGEAAVLVCHSKVVISLRNSSLVKPYSALILGEICNLLGIYTCFFQWLLEQNFVLQCAFLSDVLVQGLTISQKWGKKLIKWSSDLR